MRDVQSENERDSAESLQGGFIFAYRHVLGYMGLHARVAFLGTWHARIFLFSKQREKYIKSPRLRRERKNKECIKGHCVPSWYVAVCGSMSQIPSQPDTYCSTADSVPCLGSSPAPGKPSTVPMLPPLSLQNMQGHFLRLCSIPKAQNESPDLATSQRTLQNCHRSSSRSP